MINKILFYYAYEYSRYSNDTEFLIFKKSLDCFIDSMNKTMCKYKLIIVLTEINNKEFINKHKNTYKNVSFEPFYGGNNNIDNAANLKRYINKHSFV